MEGGKSTNWMRKTIEKFEKYEFVNPKITVELVQSAGYVSAQNIFESKSHENDLPKWNEFSDILESIRQEIVDDLRGQIAQGIASGVIDKTFKAEADRKAANQQVTLILRYGHLVCAICAALLEFYQKIDELTDEMAQKLASNIVDSVVEKIEKDKKIQIKNTLKLRLRKYSSTLLRKYLKL